MKVLRVCNTRSKKPKLAGKIIMKWEKTDYSHSILIFDDIVYESSYFGCEIQLLDKFLKTDIIVTEARIELDDETYEALQMLADMYVTDDVPYGYLTLLGIALNETIGVKWFADGKKSMICSEFVFWVCQDILQIPDEEIDFISPKDLFEKYFKMVYV
jgi:hypothetical protein